MTESEKFPPVHPGKIIQNQFFTPRQLTVEKVAEDLSVPTYQLVDLVEGRRNIDSDLAYRFGLYFQVGAEGFLNLQKIYDLEVWKDYWAETIKKQVHPCQEKERPLYDGRKENFSR